MGRITRALRAWVIRPTGPLTPLGIWFDRLMTPVILSIYAVISQYINAVFVSLFSFKQVCWLNILLGGVLFYDYEGPRGQNIYILLVTFIETSDYALRYQA